MIGVPLFPVEGVVAGGAEVAACVVVGETAVNNEVVGETAVNRGALVAVVVAVVNSVCKTVLVWAVVVRVTVLTTLVTVGVTVVVPPLFTGTKMILLVEIAMLTLFVRMFELPCSATSRSTFAIGAASVGMTAAPAAIKQ